MLVMLALADWSDDEGRCWPSMDAIAHKARLSRSQAQRVAHRLINDGFLRVTGNDAGGKPGMTRRYQIILSAMSRRADATPTGCMDATGSADATGRTDAQEGPHGCGGRGRADATQTVSEPSVNRQKKIRASKSRMSSVDLVGAGVCRQHAKDWLKVRGKPLTLTAWNCVVTEADKAGITPAEAVRIAAENSWRGFKADWLNKAGGVSRQRPQADGFDTKDYGTGGLL